MVTFIFPPTNICIQLIWYSKILCSTIFSSFTFLIRIRMYRLYLTDYKHSFHKIQRFVFIVYHNIKNINYSFYYEPKTINCISMPYLFQFSDGFLALRDAMHETGGGRAIKILLGFPHKITDSNHSGHFAAFILIKILGYTFIQINAAYIFLLTEPLIIQSKMHFIVWYQNFEYGLSTFISFL